MKMDYEDEEIILHQSPLDQYLEEVTSEDFTRYERQPRFIPDEKLAQTFDAERSDDSSENGFISVLNRYLPNNEVIDTIDVVNGCHVLLNSFFLCDEDQKLLIDLCEEINKVKVGKEASNDNLTIDEHTKQKQTQTKTSSNKGVLSGVIVFLFSIFIPMVTEFTESITWTVLVTYISFLLLIGWLVYCMRKKSIVRNVPNDILKNIEIFIDLLSHYDKLIDKVIRHIKEVEVITHGYSQINMLQTLLHQKGMISNGKRCMKLRSSLMDGLIDLFNQIRINVKIILGNKKHMLFDYKEEYIALMPIDAFSEVLYSTETNNENVDVTPLDQLKAIVCLYRIQLSEYVYVMIISLFTYHHDKIEKHAKDVCFALEDTNKNISRIRETLAEQYDISVKTIFCKEKGNVVKKIEKIPIMSEILHSSKIHLHAALARIEEMSALFDEKISSPDQVPLDVLHTLTNQFNLSLENARFCVEDVIDKVQPKITDGDFIPTKNVEVVDEKIDNYVMFTPPDNIGDMLYEGESDAIIRRESGILDADDVANSLKESRESRKLMRELKTILSVKESPVGLVSFPLTKVDEQPVSDSEEYVCDEEKKFVEEIKEKKTHKSAYVYSPSDDNDDEDELFERERLPSIQQMGLPLGFLSSLPVKTNFNEETFGSSTEEEEDTIHDQS